MVDVSGCTTLGFVGDLMLGRGFNDCYGRFAPDSFFGDTLATLQGCDAVFGNLECAITD
jgi:poly-gamma-glutamate synthesis protein (capsule biosynthesis protein)